MNSCQLVAVALLGLFLAFAGPVGAAFTGGSFSCSSTAPSGPPPQSQSPFHPKIQRPSVATFLEQSTTSSSSGTSNSSPPQDPSDPNGVDVDIAKMRVSEIRKALNELQVDYSDCFDKESLVQRWKDARDGKVKAAATVATAAVATEQQQVQQLDTEQEKRGRKTNDNKSTQIDPDDKKQKQLLLQEIRQLTVKQLRQELAQRNLRWAGLLEKEDLVQAVWKARQRAAAFSATGLVTPGQVADLTEDLLQQELQMGASDDSARPVLVDVYATWCGPCQLLQGQLKDVAAHMQDKLRMVKMDSDQNPTLSSELRVQGLPTLILFDGKGQELDRIEGALMKDQLIQWVESKINKA